MILLLLAAAIATPAPTAQCVTAAPVTTVADIPKLQADADCFGAAAASDATGASILAKAAAAARASQKYRLDRIAVLKALPPPPPPTHTCPDGSVILATVVCPPPPPPPTQTCPDGSVILATAICPPPAPPPPSGWVLASSITPIPTTDFAFAQGVAAVAPIASNSNAPDVVGAERFICGPGQLLRDDPIVYPGQPGRSHLHQFYGNLGANANSTYDSLRKSGDSTCSGPKYPLNRSGYWVPAMLDGKGNAIRPNYETLYYKRFPANHVSCTNPAFSSGCTPIPDGLEMIAGADMLKAPAASKKVSFECSEANGHGRLAPDATGKTVFDTMDEALAVCKNDGAWALTIGISFPECWDGVHIDSPDHRAHTGYAISTPAAGPGGLSCPMFNGQRGKFMPVLRLFWSYNILSGEDTSTWVPSSDAMWPTMPRGSSIHGDYFMAWDPTGLAEWTANCIDRMASCTSGNLGGGHALTGAFFNYGLPNPRLVPLSTIP